MGHLGLCVRKWFFGISNVLVCEIADVRSTEQRLERSNIFFLGNKGFLAGKVVGAYKEDGFFVAVDVGFKEVVSCEGTFSFEE